jgi:hypothetical protein
MDEEKETQQHAEESPKPFFSRMRVRRAGSTARSKPEQPRSIPMSMRFFDTVRVTPRPSHLDEAWNDVRIVFDLKRERASGRTANPHDLKCASSIVAATLATHFPEGPKGAARAQRQFVRWLGDGGTQTPGTARWSAAFRDIGRLEDDPTKPNSLAEVCPCDGVNFSQIGRGLDLRNRAAARAKAKVWSALSWSRTPDGDMLLKKSGQPIARLTPDHNQSPGGTGARDAETRYFARTNERSEPMSVGTLREAKVLLEHWALREFCEVSKFQDRRDRGRESTRGLEDDLDHDRGR